MSQIIGVNRETWFDFLKFHLHGIINRWHLLNQERETLGINYTHVTLANLILKEHNTCSTLAGQKVLGRHPSFTRWPASDREADCLIHPGIFLSLNGASSSNLTTILGGGSFPHFIDEDIKAQRANLFFTHQWSTLINYIFVFIYLLSSLTRTEAYYSTFTCPQLYLQCLESCLAHTDIQ